MDSISNVFALCSYLTMESNNLCGGNDLRWGFGGYGRLVLVKLSSLVCSFGQLLCFLNVRKR